VAAPLMALKSPWMLLCLAAVPALVLVHLAAVRARAERSARLASEGLVATTAGTRPGWQRHAPFALFATAIAVVCFALARPTVSLALPERQGTVVLAFDVSNSMRADDLEPTRIAAAKAAAIAFAKRQPSSIRIGVVAFGDSAVTVLRPTSVKADVIAAIRRLSVGGGTSLAQGLRASLEAIAGKRLTFDVSALRNDAGAVKIGYFGSSAIVLLSAGENTSRPDPLGLAQVASTAGVRIHAVGIGTKAGTVVQIDGFSVATALDEDLLKKIAEVTDGTYHQASNSRALAQIYSSIHLELKSVEKPREATAVFASAGGLLLLLGSVLSLSWFGRVI
jgi:Ca-activated chloride channel family protein